ncbi:MAG: flagellar basal body rod protein FlgC, partial [Eubacteriaceae bacterium]
MSILSSFDISGSGMTAQKLRLDIVSQNIANAQVTRTENGEAYRRKMVVLQSSNVQS